MALSNGWQAGITVGGKLATRAQAVDAMACIGAKLQDADYEPGLFLVCVPKAMAMVLLAGRSVQCQIGDISIDIAPVSR